MFQWRLLRTLPDLKGLADRLRAGWPVESTELPGGFEVKVWAHDPHVISVRRLGTFGKASVLGFTHNTP
jgi:hypothetical protein